MAFELVTDPGPDALRAAFLLRRTVFVEEQGVAPAEEVDGLDDVAHHVVLLDGPTAVATGRLLLDRDPVKVQRVAVDRRLRGQGLGRIVMAGLEDVARRAGATRARLASQLEAIPFYERLGYVAHGDVFLDADIEHRMMDKAL